MPFDCLLITRPQIEAEELAAQLGDLGLNIVIQPAREFAAVQPSDAVLSLLQHALDQTKHGEPAPLLIFTSTRAVHFTLLQLPGALLAACQLAAIGPATAAALQQAGFDSVIQPDVGYTSEDLLRKFDQASIQAQNGWIVAAEGGREALLRGLQQRGIAAERMLVYERRAATVSKKVQNQLEQSSHVLSVWTSADAMQQLSNGLSAAAWRKVCAGEWLVISPRLAQIAADKVAADRSSRVHLSAGPGNEELARAIRKLCQGR
jgi:uroporphyrinogen-III synthase